MDQNEGIEHPHAADRKKYRVGFFAWVEVEAFNPTEASLVAEAALDWPGDWMPPQEAVEYEGVLNGYKVRASLVRTRCMMTTEVDDEAG